jgi:Na+/melibiose symporter-like transporter
MRIISLYVGAFILVLGILPAFFVKERYYESNLTKNMEHTDVLKFLKALVLNNKLVSGVIALLLVLLVWNFHAVLDVLSVHPFYILPFFFLLLLLGNVREALKNYPFRILSLFTVLFLVGTSIFDSYGRYVGTYYVLGGDKDISSIYQILGTTAYMVCSLVMIPVFRRISEKIGKPKTLGISVVLVLFSAFLTWFTFNPAYPLLQLINTMFIGAGYAGLWLMIPSMQIDVVDDDELASGTRREGTFASVFSWILKLSFCFGFLASGPLIEYAGFDWSVTNQAGWFFPWTESVQVDGKPSDIGYVEFKATDVPSVATNEAFNGFRIAFVPAGEETVQVATVGFSTDPADNVQPATGYRNMMDIDEDDPMADVRIGYVALAAEAPEPSADAEPDEGKFARFVQRIAEGHVRPEGFDLNTEVKYTLLAEGQAVPDKIEDGKSARIVVAKPMPNASVAALARLDTNQPPSVYMNMRVGYVALPAVALMIAILLLIFFPISPERAAEIREQLEARRGKV